MRFYNVNEELPEIGERVQVMCLKEMVYKGATDSQSSDWAYDGEGDHQIMGWKRLKKPIHHPECTQSQ